MKFLGIDYGDKKVGIATSDTEGVMAFSKCVIANTSNLLEDISALVKDEGASEVVIGESRNFQGEENIIITGDFNANLKLWKYINNKFDSFKDPFENLLLS